MYLCQHCRQKIRRESTEFLMDKYGLTDEYLIAILAGRVPKSDPALFKAIALKDMLPAGKLEASGPEGGPIELASARSRLSSALVRILARAGEAEGSGEPESGGDEEPSAGDGQLIQG